MNVVHHAKRAFTLVELLVVVAVMALLLGLAASGISGFTKSYDYTKSIGQITSYLEIARAESMSKNMWTWVGMKQTTNTSGTPELLLLAVGSKNGSDDRASANLVPVAKPMRFPNVDLSKLDPSLTNILDGTDFPFAWNISGSNVNFSKAVLAISPQGEVLLKNNNIPPWIEIGVVQKQGNQTNPDQSCSILVSGISGQIIVKRP